MASARVRLPKLTEAEFQRMVIVLARHRGFRVAHFRKVRVQRKNGSVYYETPAAADGAGFPDLVLIGRGRVIFAELKVGKNKPTAAQVEWLKAIQSAGAEAYLWFGPRDWPDIEKALGAR